MSPQHRCRDMQLALITLARTTFHNLPNQLEQHTYFSTSTLLARKSSLVGCTHNVSNFHQLVKPDVELKEDYSISLLSASTVFRALCYLLLGQLIMFLDFSFVTVHLFCKTWSSVGRGQSITFPGNIIPCEGLNGQQCLPHDAHFLSSYQVILLVSVKFIIHYQHLPVLKHSIMCSFKFSSFKM